MGDELKGLVLEAILPLSDRPDPSAVDAYWAPNYIEHNPVIADGVSGLGGAIQSGVWAAVVERCDRIVAEGNFVFTQGKGTLAGRASAFSDLFRVENGKLVEHWDVVYALAELPPV